MSQTVLIEEINNLVTDLPGEVVEKLTNALRQGPRSEWSAIQSQAIRAVTQPGVRQRVKRFLEFWQANAKEIQADSVALAISAVAHAAEVHRQAQSLELVWTGPDSQIIPLRRTDQALLQLIKEAQKDLQIVSFAVYKAEAITKALVKAAQRGVSISIYLETPDASEGKIAYDTIKALGQDIAQHARIYNWPLENRAQSESGKHGSLHAKVAVADGQTMLISSANLTEYAMTLNMELGILIRGGPLPAQIQRHLTELVEKGVFELL